PLAGVSDQAQPARGRDEFGSEREAVCARIGAKDGDGFAALAVEERIGADRDRPDGEVAQRAGGAEGKDRIALELADGERARLAVPGAGTSRDACLRAG